jgi:hypothetical protein
VLARGAEIKDTKSLKMNPALSGSIDLSATSGREEREDVFQIFKDGHSF